MIKQTQNKTEQKQTDSNEDHTYECQSGGE